MTRQGRHKGFLHCRVPVGVRPLCGRSPPKRKAQRISLLVPVPPSSLPRGVFSAERAEPRCGEFGRLGEFPEVPADETVRLRCSLLQAAFFLAVSHSIVTYNSSPGKKSHSSHTSSAPGRFSKCLLFPHIQIYILIRRFFGASALSTGILLPNPAPEFVSLHPHHSAVLPTPR